MKKIKLLLKPKFIISFVALTILIAGASYAIAKNQKGETESEALWRDDFHHSFFGGDIFAEMEEMDKRMNKIFAEHKKIMAKMIQNADQSGKKSGTNNFLALYQDEGFYRYELTFNSFKKEDVVITVDNNIMTISARSEKSKKKKDKDESRSVNNFFYSLTIPSDAVGDPEIKRDDGKITITLKKSEAETQTKTH